MISHSLPIFLLGLLLLLSVMTSTSSAMHITTSVDSGDQIQYLGKFCFDQGKNTGMMWGWTSSSNRAQDFTSTLVFVNDDDWAILKSAAGNCTNVNNLLRSWQAESAVYWCAPYSTTGSDIPGYCDGQSAPLVANSNFTMIYSAYTRSRFWYAAVVNCHPLRDTPTAVNMDINMWIVNGDPDGSIDPFNYQFSFEYQGALGLFIAYFVLYTVLVAIRTVAHVCLYSPKIHLMIKIFTAAMYLEYISVLCNLIHYGAYSQDGQGVPRLYDFGTFVQISSQCVFMLLLIAFAKGWSISVHQLSSKKVPIGLWIAYSLLYIILFIWMKVGENPESLENEYQTWPGGLILTLRCLILIWFIIELRQTHKLEFHAEKLMFYKYFGIAYTIWFVALPIVVIIAAIIDPRWRYKCITGLFYTINFISFSVMTYFLWPSRAAIYFAITDNSILEDNTEESALPHDDI